MDVISDSSNQQLVIPVTLYAWTENGLALVIFSFPALQTDHISLFWIGATEQDHLSRLDVSPHYDIAKRYYWCITSLREQKRLLFTVTRENVTAQVTVSRVGDNLEAGNAQGIALSRKSFPRYLFQSLKDQLDELPSYLALISYLLDEETEAVLDPSGSALYTNMLALASLVSRSYDRPLGWSVINSALFSFSADNAGNGTNMSDSPVICFPEQSETAFFGREGLLETMHDELSPRGEARSIVLSGIAGGGKSRLAIEYAYRYRDEYTHLFWADARDAERLLSSYRAFAHAMEIPGAEGFERDRLIASVQHWFAAHSGWLLVFDDAAEMIEWNALSWTGAEFFPFYSHYHVLVTTRARYMSSRVPKALEYNLEGLSPREALHFLLHQADIVPVQMSSTEKRWTIHNLPEEECGALLSLLEAVEYLPLALSQIGSYVAETHTLPSDAFALYQKKPLALLERRGENSRDHPLPIAQVLFQSIRDVENHPDALAILKVCAFLGTGIIPAAVLERGGQWLFETLRSGLSVSALPFFSRSLARHSLFCGGWQFGGYTPHRIVSQIIRAEMSEEEQLEWSKRAILMVDYTLEHPGSYRSMFPWPGIRPLVQHCLRLLEQQTLSFSEASRIRSAFLRQLLS